MNNIRTQIRKLLRENATHHDIIGKKVGEVFNPKDFNGIYPIADKTITYAKFFPAKGEDNFTAHSNAESYLESEGYVCGSMYSDYPIGFIKEGKFGMSDDGTSSVIIDKWGNGRPFTITKWDRMSSELMDKLDGIMIPDKRFRGGNAYVVFFEFPE